ncbi:DinB family protein [Mucilaginibacter sp. X4EP1]|uniref:DinB family protein n=1 Tax=Mucilaginibacter sp. X4EP1 TaxID=2723092 RepID=UPI00216774F7|nr:DinB family protein [Mucilaginibacter sp. X4EP1]MCS3813890.1 hypothetical protein [Mucilaginibacter sp. X4EP1]
MNIAKERKAIDEALDSYRSQLDTIPDEMFTLTPPDGGWSFAEAYSHILQATLGSLIALERCTHDNCKPTKEGLNIFGKIMLFTGVFPRVKAPEKVNAKMPAIKIDKEEARNLIVKCRMRLDEITPLIKKSSPASRHKHPRLGMLNAKQWLKFIRIHLKHHLKQLKRIDEKISK